MPGASGQTSNQAPPRGGAPSRALLYVVCSAHPRLGKTLLARLLVEFFLQAGRPVAAFDVNPDEPGLVDYLPAYTALASIADTKGEVALFDQLIARDATAKVVDLGQGLIDAFFRVAQHIDFLNAARHHSILPVVLFVLDPHPSSVRTLAALEHRHPELTIVPVYNEAVARGYPFEAKLTGAGRVPVRMPTLSPALNSIIDRHSFTFGGFLAKPVEIQTELHEWIKRIFIEFRELELRLLLENLRSTFKS
jgi:hypothetical protein